MELGMVAILKSSSRQQEAGKRTPNGIRSSGIVEFGRPKEQQLDHRPKLAVGVKTLAAASLVRAPTLH
jgi:hypothetical protein